MNLQALKLNFESTGSTDIEEVSFDLNTFLNADYDKSYPYVFWDLDNSKWTKDYRSGVQTVILNVYCLVDFNEHERDKMVAWDEAEEALDEYLVYINTLADFSIESTDVDKEYYPPGVLSVDGEVGVRYNVKIKLWC
jgi:hypothetical protein